MKKPIITTTIGCEGINLRHGISALFADTAEDFASAIFQLQDDPQLRGRLADTAYETVQREYDWNSKGIELDAAYQSVLESHRKTA